MSSDSSDASDRDSLIEAIAEKHDADIVLYAGDILYPAHRILHGLMRDRTKLRKNVILFLTTGGGSADIAYQFARCLQFRYKEGKFILFVHTYCKSAGTLIATGADEIVMSDEAELGPLDVQVYKRDELGERMSGLTPIQALTALRREAFRAFEQYLLKIRLSSGFQITTMTAAQIAAKLTNGCFGPIYRQLDPMGLGEHQRAMAIASDYGERLDTGNLKPHSLDRLIAGYPSHEFVIDREEGEDLFHSIRPPDPLELTLALCLEEEIETAIRDDELDIRFLSREPRSARNANDGDIDEKDTGQREIPASAGAEGGAAAGPNGEELGSERRPASASQPSTGAAHSAGDSTVKTDG